MMTPPLLLITFVQNSLFSWLFCHKFCYQTRLLPLLTEVSCSKFVEKDYHGCNNNNNVMVGVVVIIRKNILYKYEGVYILFSFPRVFM